MHVLVCTVPSGTAPDFLRQLLDARLVACGNIIPGVRSLYRWKGAIEDEAEELLVMETARPDTDATIAAIAELHPYEVPKVLAISPDAALPAYVQWAREQTSA